VAAKQDPRSTPTVPVTHPGFLLSCGFGAVGLVVIVVGLLAGATNLVFEIGLLFGSLSLLAALAWRADLVSSWKRDHTPR
jgi:hypothetical protein